MLPQRKLFVPTPGLMQTSTPNDRNWSTSNQSLRAAAILITIPDEFTAWGWETQIANQFGAEGIGREVLREAKD